ncbi:MAG: polysaccharide deacetylase family protein [Clostridiales bacterium]|jgi:peptidoglycan/xylan/chitin deacetylase (PgdA/CDA1 family)|nr:polysaccharide deacetylase family protein [Clostridiales bacterium]
MRKAGDGKSFHIYALGNAVIFLTLAALFIAAFAGGGAIAAAGNSRAYYRGNSEKPYVSLMINVYTGGEYIEPMMRVFEEYGVKATFFIGGSFAMRNGALVKKICENGHEIGNHGYYHRSPEKLSYKENYDEIIMNHRLIEEICGIKMTLFAPPSGSVGKEMFKASADLGYDVIMWSKDTIDWRDKDPNLTFERAVKNLKNGDLVLMHPTAHTLEALPKILRFYKDNKFQEVTVSKNISKETV